MKTERIKMHSGGFEDGGRIKKSQGRKDYSSGSQKRQGKRFSPGSSVVPWFQLRETHFGLLTYTTEG